MAGNHTGKSGPPRKPTALKLLHGTFRADTVAENEPMPVIEDHYREPPEHLSFLARQEWLRVAPILHPLGLLTSADYQSLEIYCEAYAEWRDAKRVRDLKTMNTFATQARQFLTEFGMTPASRSRINVLTDEGSGKKKSSKDKNFA